MPTVLTGHRSTYTLDGDTPLASGRLSDVFVAHDDANGATVAVKRFHRYLQAESLDSYLRELATLSMLQHPHILAVLDQGAGGDAGDENFLVLPYMPGGNLRRLLGGRSFCPPAMAVPILRQVAEGIDHAHACGIIHGDIKPENVLLGGAGAHVAAAQAPVTALLADFGIARHFDFADTVSVTVPQGLTRAGTSAYLSREQLLDNQTSPMSDLYSFALVAYELLTGRLPFDVRAPLFIQLKARVDGDLLPPKQANRNLGDTVCAALMRALDVDPARRPSSAGAFVRSLELTPKRWDVFIAHAGADLGAASQLFRVLDPLARVFLDDARLRLGDNWDAELAAAQRDALVTVVLVSQRTEAAFYQREEIAAAIQMARNDPQAHRVVPVYLDPASAAQPPYGLSIKHGVRLEPGADFTGLAQQLVQLVGELNSAP